MTKYEAEGIEVALDKAMGKINEVSPELAQKLQEKYEADQKEFSQAAREFSPSNEPGYWAKNSCRKCYGRGIIGKGHMLAAGQSALSAKDPVTGQKILINSKTTYDIHCNCTDKNYKKWLTEFRLFFNALKAQNAEGAPDESDDEKED